MPDRSLSIAQGALMRPFARMPMADSWYGKVTEAVARAHGWDPTVPLDQLPAAALEHLLTAPRGEQVRISYHHDRGDSSYSATFEGLIPNLERRYKETDSDYVKSELERFMVERPCPACGGKRLKPAALGVTVAGLDIAVVSAMAVSEAMAWAATLPRAAHRARAAPSPARCSRRSPPGWASSSTWAWTT